MRIYRRIKRTSHKRSFAKNVTWRFCATLTTVVSVRMFASKLAAAFSVGRIEVVAKKATDR
ncbi:MAG: DUF2061 domain-containing protein [Phycisphaerales bacterium]|nr:MAG: DUF2061 domain-containing protein [Phycisphaerales bacterium]